MGGLNTYVILGRLWKGDVHVQCVESRDMRPSNGVYVCADVPNVNWLPRPDGLMLQLSIQVHISYIYNTRVNIYLDTHVHSVYTRVPSLPQTSKCSSLIGSYQRVAGWSS